MANITYRITNNPTIPNTSSVKGAPLTFQELDANFKALNDDIASKASIVSPAFTGIPTAPTAAPGTNTDQIATTAFVVNTISTKANINSPSFTGTPTAPTAPVGTNNNQIATTAFVVNTLSNNLTSKADTHSPSFTGTPTAPTAAPGTNTDQIATTAFVTNAVSTKANINSPAFTGTPTAPTAAPGTSTDQIATTAFVTDAISIKANINSPAFTGTPTAPTAAPGTNTNQLATTAFVNNTVSSLFTGFKNIIINGKMEIAQRGTNFSNISNSFYSLDRWLYNSNGSQVISISQHHDAPSFEFQKSLFITVTTANTNILSNDYSFISQRIEGYNVRNLINRSFTLSFWVRSSKSGTHCVAFRNNGFDRTYIVEYIINTPNTWEFKTITINNGLITNGSWNWENGIGLEIIWVLAAGSSFRSSSNSWLSGNFICTNNQVNCLDNTGNIFALTGVQLESGNFATPFEHRPFGLELQLCQRYYEKSYNYDTAVPTATNLGATQFNLSGTSSSITIQFSTEKRASPTIILYETISTTSGSWDNNTITRTASAINIGTRQFVVNVSGGVNAETVQGHWVANAEL